MRTSPRTFVIRTGLLTMVTLGLLASAGIAGTLTIRSGNAPIGQPDPLNRFLAQPSGACGIGFPAAFTAADFGAASGGPNALTLNGFFPWLPSLACDPIAQWIAVSPNYGPVSALFAQSFTIPAPCCIQSARLTLCWAVDDWLGDLDTNINTGAYLNGVPLNITGGNYGAQTTATVDVSSILHCGTNTLYMYDRDAACVVSGLMYSATVDYIECETPVQTRTWGSIKALYR